MPRRFIGGVGSKAVLKRASAKSARSRSEIGFSRVCATSACRAERNGNESVSSLNWKTSPSSSGGSGWLQGAVTAAASVQAGLWWFPVRRRISFEIEQPSMA